MSTVEDAKANKRTSDSVQLSPNPNMKKCAVAAAKQEANDANFSLHSDSPPAQCEQKFPVSPSPPTKEYINAKIIGSGTYAHVFLAYIKGDDTKQPFAIKKLSNKSATSLSRMIIMEVKVMRDLSVGCPHIISTLDFYTEDQNSFIVMPYIETTLGKQIRHAYSQKGHIPRVVIRRLMNEILTAMAHAHKHRYVHQDLKPDNLLIDAKGNLFVSDWGLTERASRKNRIPYTAEVVTRWYRAPELLLKAPLYTSAIDMWSVGCIMAEMYTSVPILQGKDVDDQLKLIADVLGCPTEYEQMELPPFPEALLKDAPARKPLSSHCPEHMSKSAGNLLEKLLEYSPSRRITAREALKHPYFSEE
jgi:serine/threonine protein kinase